MQPEPERYQSGQRVRIRSSTANFDGRYADVTADRGDDGVSVMIADQGVFTFARDQVAPAALAYTTDDDVARRLRQIEMRLLTAQAEIPGMVREIHDLRQQLERE